LCFGGAEEEKFSPPQVSLLPSFKNFIFAITKKTLEYIF
jgi:hypothetical protein